MPDRFDLAYLNAAIAGGKPAMRTTIRLDPISPKIFPPTYEGGKYAEEKRVLSDGREIDCVLLDSVASQANRMESALQEAWEGKDIEIPMISADFGETNGGSVGKITTFVAPHRVADAIIRDSLQDNVPFRKSPVGLTLNDLSLKNAGSLLRYAPHCLIFGIWDSTGPRGGGGFKLSRAIVSEIVGFNAVKGVKTSSRIDPLNIMVNSGPLYESPDGSWTLSEKLAVKEKNAAVKIGKEGKPSEANHGNVTPSIAEGGFTIEYAEQNTAISFNAIRRLRFPLKKGDRSTTAVDIAGRAYVASIGILGAVLAIENGYDLRSRCMLRSTKSVEWEILGRPGEPDEKMTITKADALKLYQDALAMALATKLQINLKEIVLTPKEDFIKMVEKSAALAANLSSNNGEEE